MCNRPASSRDLSGFPAGDDRFVKVGVGVAPRGMMRSRHLTGLTDETLRGNSVWNQKWSTLGEVEIDITSSQFNDQRMNLNGCKADVRAECKRSEVLSGRWIDDLRGCSSDRPHHPRSLANNRYKRPVQWNSAASLHAFPVSAVKKSCCCGIHWDRMSRLMERRVFFCSDLIWFVTNGCSLWKPM